MKAVKILATAAIITSLSLNVAFAEPGITVPNAKTQQQQIGTFEKDKDRLGKKDFKKSKDKFSSDQDPIKALEHKKERVQVKLKEGKITKEKANEIIARIDARIKKIQDFNKLTLQQKKDKLISDFKAHMDKKVKGGKLSRDKADELIKMHTEKVNQWDGNGYPKFFKRDCNKKNNNKRNGKIDH